MRFILDASLALAWCFEDEQTEFTEGVLESLPSVGAAVPSLWIYEVGNGLCSGQRRGRITEKASNEAVSQLSVLPITAISLSAQGVLGEARVLALTHRLSVYDASYLLLAQALNLPLGTLDGAGKRAGLKQAAEHCSIEIVTENHLQLWLRGTE